MTPNRLAALIDQQVADSVNVALRRTIDSIAEELTGDILRDPEFRAEMIALIRVAFRRALTDLTDPLNPPT